ncbi:hypothetical protein ACC741_38505, partial [Rhizobium johnstonii]|uniref:hypothetical protein n=1 Tax=Rhizobium johnstonii TaxID=3019933 RepID=UPI003F9B2CF3
YTLRLWDASSQRQIGATMHHDYPINGAMFSEDEACTLFRRSVRRRRIDQRTMTELASHLS